MNALIIFFALCLFALLVFVFAFALTYIYDFFPLGQGKDLLQIAYSATFGFFDRSFLILFIVLIGASAINAYLDPNIVIGLFDIAFLLIFAFIFMAVKTAVLVPLDAMSMNVIFPSTYGVISSNWSALFVFVTLAVEATLNFRKKIPVKTNSENDVDSE